MFETARTLEAEVGADSGGGDVGAGDSTNAENQARQANTARRVEITVDDLPLHCPMPGQRLWDSHPKVYLPIQDAPISADSSAREQACPYCGTVYVLRD